MTEKRFVVGFSALTNRFYASNAEIVAGGCVSIGKRYDVTKDVIGWMKKYKKDRSFSKLFDEEWEGRTGL
jgi:hypothetical protein